MLSEQPALLSCQGSPVCICIITQQHEMMFVAGQESHSRQCVQARSQPETCRTCTGLGGAPSIQGACALTATASQGRASFAYFYSPDHSRQLLGRQLLRFVPQPSLACGLGMWPWHVASSMLSKVSPPLAHGHLHMVPPSQVVH